MRVEHGVPLAPLTTLGLGGPAKRFAEVTRLSELEDALATDEPVLVLGGGSNVVIGDRGWNGLVVKIALQGVTLLGAYDCNIVTVAAGVVWDDFVAAMVDARLAGLECLSGIPGLVGATPIQNVGAYGQEVADTIMSVGVVDRVTGKLERLTTRHCGFGYRSSKLKGNDRWIVTDVKFKLPHGPESMPIRYAELAKALGVREGERAPLLRVRETVLALRRGKGMVVDPADPESRSAGSFFTNPIVDADVAARLPADAPRWPLPDGRVKLAAAWLIERAGFAKGHTEGAVGISRKHALALVNRGGATAAQLLALAKRIQTGVDAAFGVALEPEPVIVE